MKCPIPLCQEFINSGLCICRLTWALCVRILYVCILTPRIIEVEPSVNINEGRGGDIVQVLDNRIIGRIEQSEEKPKEKEQSNGLHATNIYYCILICLCVSACTNTVNMDRKLWSNVFVVAYSACFSPLSSFR